MTITSNKFIITDVLWSYTESQEISLQSINSPVKTGVKSLTATCLACANIRSSGLLIKPSIHSAIGGILVICPACASTETVSFKTLAE